MKTIRLAATFIFFLVSVNSNAKKKKITDQSITDSIVTAKYKVIKKDGTTGTKVLTNTLYKKIENEETLKLATENNYTFNKNFFIKEKTETIKTDTGKVKVKTKEIIAYDKSVFSDAMLNVFFAEEVSSYIGDSKDLSLKKTYSVINTADKTLFLGASFVICREKETDKLIHILTLGLKAKLDKEFAALLNNTNGNLSNNIGASIKYTHVLKGTLNFTGHKDELANLNEKVLIPKYTKKVETAITAKTYDNELAEYDAIYSEAKANEKKKPYFKNKYEELYLELAEEEVSRIKKGKLYKSFWDHYITFEAFVPMSKSAYSLVPLITSEIAKADIKNEDYYPWSAKLGYTNFYKTSSDITLYASIFGSVYNNNNIETSALKSKTFQTLNPTNMSVVELSDVFYEGEFKQFTSGNISLELVTYLIKGIVGLSGAVEQNIGSEFNALNWKAGIPVSLKDGDGKPTVNFELQWKEVNHTHFLGIGVGFAFGKFIK